MESDEVIVVDTHVVIWMTGERSRLSRAALSSLSREREIIVPAICCWEYATLVLRQRIRLKQELRDALSAVLSLPRLRLQALTPEIAITAARLAMMGPMDPADQIIAATAMELNAPLVTSDERLREFPGLKTIW